jgi:exosortase
MGYFGDILVTRIKTNRANLFLAALGFTPLLWTFFVLSWRRPAYQFFPLALVAAGLLAWRAVKHTGTAVAAGSLGITRLLALATGVVCLLGNIVWSPWLGFIAFLLGMAAALWGLGGKPLLKAFAPAGLMLLTILPPPLSWDQTLILWLRSVAVDTGSALLDWLQVTHVQDGNTILLPGKTLLVDEACSGINSFILCNAFCLFWVLWRRRPLGWLLPAFTATSLFVVLGNVIRITTGAAAYYYWRVDLLTGRPHEIFGLLLLLVYCGLVLSLDQLLVFLSPPPRSPAAGQGEKTSPPVAKLLPDGLRSGPVFGFKFAGALLAVMGLGVFAAHLFAGGSHGLAALPNFSSPRNLKLSLPPGIAGWQRVNSSSGDQTLVQTLGVQSVVWRFQREGNEAEVAVDYPLDGFHNVKMCYTDNGWRVLAEDKLALPQSREDLHAMKLTMEQSIHHAVVLHSVVDEHGDWLSAPQAMASRLANTIAAPKTGYRIQLIIGGYSPLSEAVEGTVQELFFQARQTLVQQLVDQLRKTAAK